MGEIKLQQSSGLVQNHEDVCYGSHMDSADSLARENTGFMGEVDLKCLFAEYVIFKQDGVSGCE